MQYSQVAFPLTLIAVAEASITNSYVAAGNPFASPVRMFRLVNATDGDLFFSLDGVNDHFFVPASSFVLYDLCTNKVDSATTFALQTGGQWYIKYSTNPTSKSAYIEMITGRDE